MEQKNLKKVDGVFEGGGVAGIGLVGAVKVIEDAGYTFVNLAGTSAGAIVAALLAAKYQADEIKTIINSFDFRSFEDAHSIGKIPLLGQILSLLLWKGLYKGDVFYHLMRDLLAAKGIHTFGDLLRSEQELAAMNEEDKKRYRFRLRVIATDISQKKMLILPQDAADYHIEPETLEVARAIRMSMAIPFFFQPIKLARSYIVDGAVVSNFPVEIFDTPGIPQWPTFGFKLVLADERNPSQLLQQPVKGPFSELVAIFQTAMGAHDAYYLSKAKYVRTIAIDTLNIGGTDFQLSQQHKDALYQSGVKAAQEFLTTWDFETYKRYYRSGLPLPSRRQMVNRPIPNQIPPAVP